jgi:hypothetical protein
VTRLATFARVIRHSREFGASGHCLNIRQFRPHENCRDQEIKLIIRNFDLMKNEKKFDLMNLTS